MPEPTPLTRAELKTWLRLLSGMAALTDALDRQMRDDAALTLDDFGILSRLSNATGRSMRMSQLAGEMSFSPSRLSHAAARMERSGWITRSASADDGRGIVAHLTAEGSKTLEAAWPGHAQLIRQLLLDELSPEQQEALEDIFTKISRAAAQHTAGT